MGNPKICIVGGGFAGMCAAIRLKTKLGLDNFTIYDENNEFGGTWLLHSFPKCACDIAAHLYSFSFEPNPNWSQVLCSQAEILEYLKNVAKKHDLYSNARFRHQVTKMTWVTKMKKWIVVTLDLETNTSSEESFDFVISCPGALRNPSVPEIFKNFKGPLMHSATWDNSISLKDKVVGVVGNGASAVQIIPGIVKDVKKLYSFQRNPGWVLYKAQKSFSPNTRKTLEKNEWLRKLLRNYLFLYYESIYPLLKKDSSFTSFGAWMCTYNLRKQLPNRPDLWAKLKPTSPFGCQRITVSNTFYRDLGRDHVEIVTENIASVTDDGVTTEDGKVREIDVLICATGYKQVAYGLMYPTRIYIKNDINDQDEVEVTNFMRKDAEYYLGMVTNAFPNMFMVMGPNSGVLYNSVIFSMECQVHWIIKVLKRMIENEDQVFTVKKEAQDKYYTKLQAGLKKLHNGGGDACNAWFVDRETGVNKVSLDCSLSTFWKRTRNVKFNHLQFY